MALCLSTGSTMPFASCQDGSVIERLILRLFGCRPDGQFIKRSTLKIRDDALWPTVF